MKTKTVIEHLILFTLSQNNNIAEKQLIIHTFNTIIKKLIKTYVTNSYTSTFILFSCEVFFNVWLL